MKKIDIGFFTTLGVIFICNLIFREYTDTITKFYAALLAVFYAYRAWEVRGQKWRPVVYGLTAFTLAAIFTFGLVF
ncbi:hypothetical protein GKZ89_12565 [Bacillus mangrovi]|uniref:Uncharacterized protein n=1 Tax=Metabacillus mangrovi TaxID=1491830 RepID=A0A7X2S6Q3_9BACI|nr:hypothetical protein [Metabacillus mangrovi]MTH54236.1 hypothetical protein [Metabacillus mangrovi]